MVCDGCVEVRESMNSCVASAFIEESVVKALLFIEDADAADCAAVKESVHSVDI